MMSSYFQRGVLKGVGIVRKPEFLRSVTKFDSYAYDMAAVLFCSSDCCSTTALLKVSGLKDLICF